jgi:hypothetical protein
VRENLRWQVTRALPKDQDGDRTERDDDAGLGSREADCVAALKLGWCRRSLRVGGVPA